MPIPYKNFRDGASSAPVEVKKIHTNDSKESDLLEICAEDLNNAIKSSDIKGIAEALRAAFEHLDSEPHIEGPHTNKENE